MRTGIYKLFVAAFIVAGTVSSVSADFDPDGAGYAKQYYVPSRGDVQTGVEKEFINRGSWQGFLFK